MNKLVTILIYLILIQFFLFETNCNRIKNKKNAGIPEIDIKKAINTEKIFLLSTIADSIKYIKLETNEKSVFGKIEKTIITDDNIYILDENDIIYIFDKKDGSFRGKINKKGRGPGEYINIVDFFVDPKKDQIYILAFASRKVIVYDKNIAFLYEFQVPGNGWTYGMECFSNFIFLFYPYPLFWENRNYTISVLDSRGKKVSFLYNRKTEWGERPEGKIPLTHFGYFINNSSLFYWEEKSEFIMEIDSVLKIHPKYKIIDITNKKTRKQKLNEDIRKHFLLFHIIGSSRYLFFSGYYGKPIRCLNFVYDKTQNIVTAMKFDFKYKENLLRYGPQIGFYNDLDSGWPFFPSGKDTKGNLFCVFDPWVLKKLKETEPIFHKINPKIKTNIDEIINNARPSNNLVIMIVYK